MEFVDDLLTFEDLGLHLKSHGCHVANLSSLDFSAKSGIGGCLRGLLRQFLMCSVEVSNAKISLCGFGLGELPFQIICCNVVMMQVPDISILALWYHEQGNYDKAMVIIIDDMERCYGPVLSDFILMLRYVKIP